jgi:EH_Signature domain
MTFFTAKFQPLEFQKPESKELFKLGYGIKGEIITPPQLPNSIEFDNNKKARNIEQILNDVENDHLENISLLEWVYCILNKNSWDKQNPDKSLVTSQKIWQFTKKSDSLKSRLFWRLVLFTFNPNEEILAFSLTDTCPSFEPQNEYDNLLVEIVNLLFQHSYEKLAEICLNQFLQPNELLTKYSLPYQINIDDNLTLVEVIQLSFPLALKTVENINEKQINFLIETLNILSPPPQLKAVENLLNNISADVGGKYPKLVNWLKNNYGLTGNNSRWNELSMEAKNALKQWIGAINYRDFEKLVNLISNYLLKLAENCQSTSQGIIPREKKIIKSESNQLISRKVFWSNYTDRFERIRILLPSSSMKILKNNINTEDIITLIDDGSEATEVCIFDFGKWFIVEFFRGKGSETRIFPKSNELENLLFNSDDISLKKLRSLSIVRENVHDHRYCWQNDCEILLRSKNILPNKGIKYFKILEHQRGFSYDFNSGMPPLKQNQIKDRNRQLIDWKRDIQQLEEEAKEYLFTR